MTFKHRLAIFAIVYICLLLVTAGRPYAQTQSAQPQIAVAGSEVKYNKAPVGTIAEIEGTSAMASGGKNFVPQPGQPVYRDDVIETGEDSRALIVFIDETELALGENARVTVDEYIFDPDADEGNKGRFSILRGAFLFTTGLLGKTPQPDVIVETAYGSIGIRGTVFWGGPIDDEYNVFVKEGAVSFATERGRVTVREGEGTRALNRRSIPSRAQTWQEAKINRAVQTIALKDAEKARERVRQIKEKHSEMRARHREAVKGRIRMNKDESEQRRQDIRQNRLEKNREHRPDKKQMQEMQDKSRLNAQEKEDRRSDFIQNRGPQQRGPDTAPEFEAREKRHLQGPQRPQPQPQSETQSQSSP